MLEVTGIPNHTDYPVPYSALVDGTLGTRTSKYDCHYRGQPGDPHITINLRQEDYHPHCRHCFHQSPCAELQELRDIC
ncbi:hypothetical protein Hamer_G010982 [Homarus americanus]|uniref:Uncharacterized protein n=1 Tax=Homarus americanus TaxID=6706 RepID=A0A8J5MW96_HOMAM|nr:hypothetical protein Hamer_G010982 [Homarus americanus]